MMGVCVCARVREIMRVCERGCVCLYVFNCALGWERKVDGKPTRGKHVAIVHTKVW